MTKDITERLRDYAKDYTTTTYHDDLICEAATEIESLRQQLEAKDAEIKRLGDGWGEANSQVLSCRIDGIGVRNELQRQLAAKDTGIAELRKELAEIVEQNNELACRVSELCMDRDELRQQLEYRTNLLRQARLLLKHGKGKDDILTVECVGRIDEALK